MRAKPTVSLFVRVSPNIKTAAERAAEARGQTLREFLENVLTEATERIADRGAEIQSNRTLARLSAMFNWALGENRITASPAAGVKKRVKEEERDRDPQGPPRPTSPSLPSTQRLRERHGRTITRAK